MASTLIDGSAPARASDNRLLASLPSCELDKLIPWLELVELTAGFVVSHPHVKIEHVYFPTSGSISMVLLAPDGAVEVASVGTEGYLGVSALLYGDSMPTRAFVQSAGHAFRLEVEVFRAVVNDSAVIQQLFSRYALSLLNQIAQAVACNRLHSLESRCARWLLVAHDRVDGDRIFLTQESLSYMMGVHRPAVTLAAGGLQRAGFIGYDRGMITIMDRPGLESSACTCYKAIRADFDQLVGALPPAADAVPVARHSAPGARPTP